MVGNVSSHSVVSFLPAFLPENIMPAGTATHHDDKGKAVVKNDAERVPKSIESAKVRTLHDGIGHNLHDEPRVVHDIVVGNVHAKESLEETNDDNNQERKEDDGLLHHDLQDHQHGAEEAEGVQVQHQADPEHWRAEGQEVVAETAVVEVNFWVVLSLGDGHEPEDKACHDERIQCVVERIPKAEDVVTGLPELGELVQDEAKGEDVQDDFDGIEAAVRVEGREHNRVQGEVDDGDEHLGSVLVHGGAHAVRFEVSEQAGVRLVLVVDKGGRVVLVLHQPAAPEIVDALLIARAADDAQRMQVDGLLHHIGGRRRRAVHQDAVPLQQNSMEQEVGILLFLDAVVRRA